MTRFLAVLACVIGADAIDKEYPGYFHFKDLSMVDGRPTPSFQCNAYVTPGDGAHDLGYQKTEADLALAKHLCDEYDSCMFFNGDSTGYPGCIGWWNANATVDTYLKNTTGTVVPGYFHQNSYLNLPAGYNIFCNKIAGPWALPPDQVKAQCDELTTCEAFIVKNDLSSGFLCKFRAGDNSFIKLPSSALTYGIRNAPKVAPPTPRHDDAAVLAEYDGYYQFKGNLSRGTRCPADRPHLYGDDQAGYYCCEWPAIDTCAPPAGASNVYECCVLPGSDQGCQGTPRCGTNPKNETLPYSIFNSYVTPGDGANPLGAQKTPSDLALAKHFCDQYDSCAWFDSCTGYPGAIGWWNPAPTQTTYLKHSAGTVVPGSSYFDTEYMRIPGVEVYCNLLAGPWKLPPDQVKAQCDQLATCHGFTVMNDLSSGFLCAFTDHGDHEAVYESFLKLPLGRRVAAHAA